MIISVRVKPNAKKPEVETGDGKSYSVKVDAPPESGKANRRLIGILADYFGVPKSGLDNKGVHRQGQACRDSRQVTFRTAVFPSPF